MKLLHQSGQSLRIRYQQKLDFPIHLHNALEIVLLTTGQTTVLYGSRRINLQAGELFIAFPGKAHGYENSRNAQGYVLIIPTVPWLEGFRDILEEKQPETPILTRDTWEQTGIRYIMELALAERPNADHRVMQGYILLLVGKLLPQLTLTDAIGGDTDSIQELLLFLHDHYTEPLTRQEIARAVGYNESYISHLFSDALGTTLTNYITSLRLEDACRLLKDTGNSVSSIAAQLGFGSIRSFNRVFFAHTGCTPTAYRREKTGR